MRSFGREATAFWIPERHFKCSFKRMYSPGSGLYVDLRPRGSPSAEHQRRSISRTGASTKRANPAGRGATRRTSGSRMHRQTGAGSALEGPSSRRQGTAVG